jgi:hypothetical protein
MTTWRYASVLLLAAAFDLGGGLPARADARADRCYAVRVRAAGSDASGGRHGRVFSAATAKDLAIEVSVPDAAASRPVQVKLFTPRGRLYQVIDAGADEEVSGDRGRRRRRGRSMVAEFPVAGTPVTTHALFGEWRAEVYLDGSETRCARPLEFVIER